MAWGDIRLNDDRRPQPTDHKTSDEIIVEHSGGSDQSQRKEPAIERWRAELEARRRAGIPDAEVVELEERPEHPGHGRFRFRWFVWVALAILGVLLVDLAYVGFGLRSRLLSASSSLSGGREAINDADYEEANREFSTALHDARETAGLEDHLAWRAIRRVPWASNDAQAVSVLASVAELSARAGLDAIELYERLGATRSGLAGALFKDGVVRLESVALAARSVSSLLTTLGNGADLVNEDVEPRLGSLNDALNRVRGEVSGALETLRRAETLLTASPSLFGQDEDREYLLVIQNPSRSRASGGVIEYYGVFTATQGKLKLGPVLPISTLEEADSAQPWSRVNRSMNFPAVARQILTRYEDQSGRRLQGVIGADSIALQHMSRVTGPVRGEGLDLAVGEDNAAKILMHDVFEHFSGRKEARDRFVADVVRQIWFSVTKGVGDSSVLLDELGRAIREQHMKMFVSDPSSRVAMDQLELSGDPTLFGPRVQSMAQNSLSTSKVDFFLRREASTRIELEDDGSASIESTLTIENRAPAGPPSSVLGMGARPGTASLSIEMLLPREAEDVTLEGKTVAPTESVRGHPLLVTRETVPPGRVHKVAVSYELPPTNGQNSLSFSMVLLPAPLPYPDRASVSVLAPEGYCIESCEDPSPSRWDLSTTLLEPLPIQVRLVSADD